MKGRLLVTGASGLVGSHVVLRARDSWEVHGIFRRQPAPVDRVEWHRLDLTDAKGLQGLVRSLRPDVILHAAALTDVDRAERQRATAEAINVRATHRLAEAAAAFNLRLVYVSSDMVLDGDRSWYREQDPARPVNYYGHTKLMGEEIVRKICPNSVVARTALIYGRPISGTNSASEWLIEALRRGSSVRLFHDQFRTPIWVENLAEVLLELCATDWSGTVHLGGPERLSRLQFGQRLCRRFSLDERLLEPVSMDSVRTVAPRPRDVSLDTSWARSLLSTPLLDCDTALSRMARASEVEKS